MIRVGSCQACLPIGSESQPLMWLPTDRLIPTSSPSRNSKATSTPVAFLGIRANHWLESALGVNPPSPSCYSNSFRPSSLKIDHLQPDVRECVHDMSTLVAYPRLRVNEWFQWQLLSHLHLAQLQLDRLTSDRTPPSWQIASWSTASRLTTSQLTASWLTVSLLVVSSYMSMHDLKGNVNSRLIPTTESQQVIRVSAPGAPPSQSTAVWSTASRSTATRSSASWWFDSSHMSMNEHQGNVNSHHIATIEC